MKKQYILAITLCFLSMFFRSTYSLQMINKSNETIIISLKSACIQPGSPDEEFRFVHKLATDGFRDLPVGYRFPTRLRNYLAGESFSINLAGANNSYQFSAEIEGDPDSAVDCVGENINFSTSSPEHTLVVMKPPKSKRLICVTQRKSLEELKLVPKNVTYFENILNNNSNGDTPNTVEITLPNPND